MAAATPAYVTPRVLRWARESIGMAVGDAAKVIGVSWSELEAAEEGYDLLTLRQAEKAAEVYDRPLATFFLPEPPREEPQEVLFRRLPGAPPPPWSSEMRVLARRIRARQDAAAELHDLLEERPRWADASHGLRATDRDALASVVRSTLGISLEEQQGGDDRTGYATLRAWIDAVEALGILVMQDGSLPVTDMRGFASRHEVVPAIVVNSKDDPRARAFTVVHELGHLALIANGIQEGAWAETWCNDFAGEVIMPPKVLRAVFGGTTGQAIDRRILDVSMRFGVTPAAAIVRLARNGLIAQDLADEALARLRAREEPPRKPGGNYYRNQVAWLGPAYIRLVFDAVDGQAVTLSNAAGLLGVKVNHFDRLRRILEERTEFG